MSNITDTATITTRINGQQAENELKKLEDRAHQLRDAISKAYLAGDTKKQKQFEKQLRDVNKEAGILKKSMWDVNAVLNNMSGASINDLNKALRQLTSEMDSGKIERNTAAWDVHRDKIKSVRTEISKLRAEQSENQGVFSRFANGFNKYGAMAAGALATITGLSFTFRKLSEDVAHMDDVYSDVMKTTGMTRDEVVELNEEFKKMDTRTAREDLNKIAEAGGRIGVAKEHVLEFTSAMDIANVALGDSFTGGVEEISTELGKLKMLFAETKDMKIEQAYLSIASSINELGANGSASEPNIAEFATRVGSLPEALKPSVANTLALGAAFEESGIEAEISSRAYNIFLKQASTGSDKFAKVMGITQQQVEDLINTDPMEFFLKFSQGMRGMDATKVSQTLDYLGINADGANKAIGAAANNTERFRELILLSNEAFTEGNSVINEYNIKNNNLQAQLDKSKKKFFETALSLGEKLSPAMLKSVNATTYLIRALTELPKFLSENRGLVIALMSSILAYTAALTASTVKDKLKVFWNQKVIVSFKKLWATLAANPYLAIAAGAAILVGILVDLIRRNNEVTQSQKSLQNISRKTSEEYDEQAAKIDSLNSALHDENLSLSARKKALNELRKIVPAYHAELTAEGKLINDNTSAIDAYLVALEKQIRFKAAQEEREELFRKKRLQEREMSTAQDQYNKLSKVYELTPVEAGQRGIGYQSDLAAANTAQNILDGKKRELNETMKAINMLNKELKDADDVIIAKSSVVVEDTGTSDGGYASNDGLKDANKEKLDIIEQDLAKLRATYAAEYAIGLKNKQQYDEAINDAELQALNSKKALYKDGTKEYLDIVQQIALKEIDINKSCNDLQLQDLEKTQKETRKVLTDKYVQGEIDFKKYQDALHLLEYDELVAKRNIYAEGTEEYKKAQQAVTDWLNNDQLAKRKEYESSLAEYRKEYSKKTNAELMNAELALFNELATKIIIAEEEKQKIIAGIRKKYNNGEGGGDALEADSWKSTLLTADESGKGFFDSLIGNDIDLVKKQFETIDKWAAESGATTSEVFQQKGEAIGVFLEKNLQKYQAVISQVSAITNALASFVSAKYEAQEAQVTSRYDAEIKAAGKNSRKIAKLEEQKAAEIDKIKAEANDKSFGIQVAQAIAGTAMSAISAYASASAIPVVGWVMGPIAAAAAVAAGAIQIATIQKQHSAAKKNYWDGGYTPKGKWNEEQGIVHSDEFVANRFATANKSVRPVLDLIDTAQKNNTVGRLTSDDVSRVLGSKNNGNEHNTSSNNSSQLNSTINAFTVAADRLNKQLDEGIVSVVSITGKKGFEEEYAKYKKLITNKSRK